MKKVHLLVEDIYLEAFMDSLPKDKVVVIEKDFEKNQELMQDTLEKYENNSSNFTAYYESMKNLSTWLKERES